MKISSMIQQDPYRYITAQLVTFFSNVFTSDARLSSYQTIVLLQKYFDEISVILGYACRTLVRTS